LKLPWKEAALLDSLRIESNGIRTECADASLSCNGITLNGSGNNSLRNSQVRNHSGWGISAILIQCGSEEDDYQVNLTLEKNVFEITNSGKVVCLSNLR